MSLYEDLLAIDAEIANHRSDLYVQSTPEVDKIMEKYEKHHKTLVSRFVSEGEYWYDIAFAFDPYWEAVSRKVEARKLKS